MMVAVRLTDMFARVFDSPRSTEERAVDWSHRSLVGVCENVTNLRRLEWLILGHNALKAVPIAIYGMTHLRALTLNNNAIENLSPKIGDLKALLSLDLRQNRLAELPFEVGLLPLRELLVTNNCLAWLPISFESGFFDRCPSSGMWGNTYSIIR